MVASKLRCAHLTATNIIEEADTAMKNEAQGYVQKGAVIPTELWVRLLQARTKLFDCIKKGWVMDGFPETRDQAHALASNGIFPKHCGLC